MIKRWKMEPKPIGLAAVCAGERSSYLHVDGSEDYIASVTHNTGKWGDNKGWFWVAPNNKEYGITYKNTCGTPLATEKEAKIEARSYIDKCIKENK